MPIGSDPGADTVPGYATWRKGVAGVLAKSRKVDASEFGDEPERHLAVTNYDGVSVAPLYTRRDELPEPALPGSYPYIRGNDGTRDVTRGWFVSAPFGGADAGRVNEDILAGLDNGVSAIWLTVGGGGVPVADLPAAVKGVLFDLAPLSVRAGSDTAAAAEVLLKVLDGYQAQDRAAIRIFLGAEPLTSSFAGREDIDLDGAVALARTAATRAESVRAITVSGTDFHNAGASDAQEIGASVAAGLEYLRVLTESGLDVDTALRQLSFRFAATDDQFETIAKFRAARRVWSRVAHECAAPEAGNAPQHAVTSEVMISRRDPWVNMLRTTLAAFGAGVGGADLVTVLPFDAALPAGELGVSRAFSERMARNTQLLLLEESHLGHVQDPGAGSWHVESLTDELAKAAWAFMQEIERAGGYRAAAESGALADAIAETAARREADIAHRRTAVTGVNEFPNLAEEPLSEAARAGDPVRRYGAVFEALRDRSDAYLSAHGHRPRALLVPLGPVAEHNVRVTFSANVLASGGIETVNPGPLDAAGIAAAATESETTMAVLCGTDTRYGDEAAAAVERLRAAGVRTVLLAGPEKAVSAATGASRPDGFLTARMDAAATLSGLLEKLGA
ncbi:MAG: methylmalonyl-CoA mutase [Nocardia sp.]|nr:methylmalonyl-CoA mutase [Nocardia sp.]